MRIDARTMWDSLVTAALTRRRTTLSRYYRLKATARAHDADTGAVD